MYSFRQATIADLPAMMAIGHEGLKPHLQAHRVWDQAQEELGFREHFTPECIQIVQVDNRDIGYLKKERRTDHYYIDGIYLSKHYRNQGIGRQILADILNETTLPVRLRVYKSNPAQKLYIRLGFRIISTSHTSLNMEYQP